MLANVKDHLMRVCVTSDGIRLRCQEPEPREGPGCHCVPDAWIPRRQEAKSRGSPGTSPMMRALLVLSGGQQAPHLPGEGTT